MVKAAEVLQGRTVAQLVLVLAERGWLVWAVPGHSLTVLPVSRGHEKEGTDIHPK